MKIERVRTVYFSPSGTTEKIAREFTETFDQKKQYFDLLETKGEEEITFEEDDIAVVAMPVFGGRIPSCCEPMMEKLKGNKTPAVIMAVYGNREYEDTLVQMQDYLEGQGFRVIGAGAFLAQHSVFPTTAAGRPDEADLRKIRNFAEKCRIQLDFFNYDFSKPLTLPGNRPYREYMTPSMYPTADDSCTKCLRCVSVCPAGAIDKSAPGETDAAKCLMCTACIAKCPVNARAFRAPGYSAAQDNFKNNYGQVRKEPELFL